MLKSLKSALFELPQLLLLEDWNSLHITYEPPEVLLLWRQWGDHRIFLHQVLPCPPGKSLYHPHPWPSIVMLVDGNYRMGIGYGPGLQEPPLAMTARLSKGDWYEMLDPDGWHFIEPTAPSLSIMVTGKPWSRAMPKSNHPAQAPLDPIRARVLQGKFLQILNHGSESWGALL